MLRSELARRLIEANNPQLLYLVPADQLMECQVMVKQGDGEAVERDGNIVGYQSAAGLNYWCNYRLPQDANTNPIQNDRPTAFPSEVVEAVGYTGWDYGKLVSRHVSFDFDSMLKSTGIPDDELSYIKERTRQLPYVTERTSKSNSGGFHLTIDLPEVPTANHGEHADLARYILSRIAADIDYPELPNKVDVVGGNFWLYHADTKAGGLQITKRATLPFTDIPADWRNHIPARQKSSGAQSGNNLTLENLEWEHKRHIEEIAACWGRPSAEPRFNCYNTHTAALKTVHEKLKLRGDFETIARGSTPGDVNCSIHPLPNGAWLVRRMAQNGQSVPEASTWFTAKSGNTCCFLNRFQLPRLLRCEMTKDDYRRQITDPVRIMKSFFNASLWHGMPTYLPVQGQIYHWSLATGCWQRLDRDTFAARLRNHITEMFLCYYRDRKQFLERALAWLKSQGNDADRVKEIEKELDKLQPKAVTRE